MLDQPPITIQRLHKLRYRSGREFLTAGNVMNNAALRVDLDLVARLDALNGLAAFENG